MTARHQLHALLRRDMKSTGPGFLRVREFEQIAWMLIGTAYDRDNLQNLLIRNRETDGAFLTNDEEAALLHVLNGGSLDVPVRPDNTLIKICSAFVPSVTERAANELVDAGTEHQIAKAPSSALYQSLKLVPVIVATSALRVTWDATVGM
jgi:hypothetical protein